LACIFRQSLVDNGTSALLSPPQISTQNFTQTVASPAEAKSVNALLSIFILHEFQLKLDFCFAGWPLRPPRQDVYTGESQLTNDPRYSRILTNNTFSERSHVPVGRAANVPKWFPDQVPFGPISDEYFEKLELGTVLFSFYYMEVDFTFQFYNQSS
jgi:hypothetical protein